MAARGKDGDFHSSRVSASPDDFRLFSRALELLSSTDPDSENELLELVKKAKRDAEKEDTAKSAGLHSANSSSEAVASSSSLPTVGASASNPNPQVQSFHASKAGSNKCLSEKLKRKAGRS